jgi:hypothetical protein
LAFDSEFQPIDIVSKEDSVILYATGLGPTRRSGGFDVVIDEVEVYMGERKAEVLFAGLAPGLQGVYQLNVKAPAPASDRLYLRSGGWQSNITEIGIRSGANATNVRGTLQGLFPSSDPNFPTEPQRPCVGNRDAGPCGPSGESFSVMLHAGSFTVSFDIVPSAGPFDVAAVGEGGSAVISINPAAGTYAASVDTATTAASLGDFSSLGVPLWDYLSCEFASAWCEPFPNNKIPLSRMSSFWVKAVRMLPTPNMSAPASPNGSFQVSGKLSGSRFVIDPQTNSNLSQFGGFVQLPYGPFAAKVSTFGLYVDGRLVASRNLPYVVFNRAQGPNEDPCDYPYYDDCNH